MSPPGAQKMLEALQKWADHPVEMELTVQQLVMIIGALQLAMRHPTFPQPSKTFLRGLIQSWRQDIWTLDADLARLVDAGNNPGYDVRSDGR